MNPGKPEIRNPDTSKAIIPFDEGILSPGSAEWLGSIQTFISLLSDYGFDLSCAADRELILQRLAEIISQKIAAHEAENLVQHLLGSNPYAISFHCLSRLNPNLIPDLVGASPEPSLPDTNHHFPNMRMIAVILMIIMMGMSQFGVGSIEAQGDIEERIAEYEERYGVELSETERILFTGEMMLHDESLDVWDMYFQMKQQCNAMSGDVPVDVGMTALATYRYNDEVHRKITSLIPSRFVCVSTQGDPVPQARFSHSSFLVDQLADFDYEGSPQVNETASMHPFMTGPFYTAELVAFNFSLPESSSGVYVVTMGEEVNNAAQMDRLARRVLEANGLCVFIPPHYDDIPENSRAFNMDLPIEAGDIKPAIHVCVRNRIGGGADWFYEFESGMPLVTSIISGSENYYVDDAGIHAPLFSEDNPIVASENHISYLVVDAELPNFENHSAPDSLPVIPSGETVWVSIQKEVFRLGGPFLAALLVSAVILRTAGRIRKKLVDDVPRFRKLESMERIDPAELESGTWGSQPIPLSSIFDIIAMREIPDYGDATMLADIYQVLLDLGVVIKDVLDPDNPLLLDAGHLARFLGIKDHPYLTEIVELAMMLVEKRHQGGITARPETAENGDENLLMQMLINAMSIPDRRKTTRFWQVISSDSRTRQVSGYAERLERVHGINIPKQSFKPVVDSGNGSSGTEIDEDLLQRHLAEVQASISEESPDMSYRESELKTILRRLQMGVDALLQYTANSPLENRIQIVRLNTEGIVFYFRPRPRSQECLEITYNAVEQEVFTNIVGLELTQWREDENSRSDNGFDFNAGIEEIQFRVLGVLVDGITQDEWSEMQEFVLKSIHKREDRERLISIIAEQLQYAYENDFRLELVNLDPSAIGQDWESVAEKFMIFIAGHHKERRQGDWRAACKPGAADEFDRELNPDTNSIISFARPKLRWRARQHLMLVQEEGVLKVGIVITKHDH